MRVLNEVMRNWSWAVLFTVVGVGLFHPVQATCIAPSLVSPAQIEISEASPRIEWTPVSEASHYLVWLESRVPEGRVLVSEEFQTRATFFIPPRPLTAATATVRIQVTAVCKDNSRSTFIARFRIDGDGACKLIAAPAADIDNGKWKVRWEPLPSAQRYEIRVHAAEDGQPVFIRQSSGTSTKIDRIEPGVWLLAVQPMCRGLKGISSWVTLGTH